MTKKKHIFKWRGKKSTQEFIGLRKFSELGLLAARGEIVYFQVAPTNIAVLSYDSVDIKVRHLLMVLSAVPDIEIVCIDSCECFDENKAYIRRRMESEPNERVRAVLEQDFDHISSMQTGLSTARQFLFCLRLMNERGDQAFSRVARTEKIIAEQGFEVRRLEKPEIKRMLAIYFGASQDGEKMGDFDGEEYFRQFKKGRKPLTEDEKELVRAKSFFDLILPGTIKFQPDSYTVGDKRCCVWAVREYPPSTEQQAVLSQLADKEGVTLHVYVRPVDVIEQRKIIQNAARKNKLMSGGTDVQDQVTAEENLEDVAELIVNMRKSREPLLHTAAYIELRADSMASLKELKSDVLMELARSKIMADQLTLRQQEGFLSALPVGFNGFGAQFERVLPASSVANLFPFGYSGKTDPCGFYIGRDKFGTNLLVDFDRRASDKTNANILILGNSGQGKSYLMKLLLANVREGGKKVIVLDADAEYEDLTMNLGGCYIDLMAGSYIINPLEPRAWTDGSADETAEEGPPEAFTKKTMLSQHISYLKDFFRSYKDFADEQIDTIEILLSKLYKRFGITDDTDFAALSAGAYPTMRDLYAQAEQEYRDYDMGEKQLYGEDTLREICLGLHSMCVGAESKYFSGQTNITDDMFVCFGVKGIMDTNRRLKDALLFNILSYISGVLLGRGNAAAAIDELYLYLTNLTAIEYIRNISKRTRKKDSMLLLASQNVDDFLIEGVKEYTKPLFAIPTHQFLFNAGVVEPRAYTDTLQLDDAEFGLIKYPERGTCLYRCGNERYLLRVIAPEHKEAMFGSAGGR